MSPPYTETASTLFVVAVTAPSVRIDPVPVVSLTVSPAVTDPKVCTVPPSAVSKMLLPATTDFSSKADPTVTVPVPAVLAVRSFAASALPDIVTAPPLLVAVIFPPSFSCTSALAVTSPASSMAPVFVVAITSPAAAVTVPSTCSSESSVVMVIACPAQTVPVTLPNSICPLLSGSLPSTRWADVTTVRSSPALISPPFIVTAPVVLVTVISSPAVTLFLKSIFPLFVSAVIFFAAFSVSFAVIEPVIEILPLPPPLSVPVFSSIFCPASAQLISVMSPSSVCISILVPALKPLFAVIEPAAPVSGSMVVTATIFSPAFTFPENWMSPPYTETASTLFVVAVTAPSVRIDPVPVVSLTVSPAVTDPKVCTVPPSAVSKMLLPATTDFSSKADPTVTVPVPAVLAVRSFAASALPDIVTAPPLLVAVIFPPSFSCTSALAVTSPASSMAPVFVVAITSPAAAVTVPSTCSSESSVVMVIACPAQTVPVTLPNSICPLLSGSLPSTRWADVTTVRSSPALISPPFIVTAPVVLVTVISSPAVTLFLKSIFPLFVSAVIFFAAYSVSFAVIEPVIDPVVISVPADTAPESRMLPAVLSSSAPPTVTTVTPPVSATTCFIA